MTKNHRSIDGLVLRRRGDSSRHQQRVFIDTINEAAADTSSAKPTSPEPETSRQTKPTKDQPLSTPDSLTRDVEDSLKLLGLDRQPEADNQSTKQPTPAKKRRFKPAKPKGRQPHRVRKIMKWFFIVTAALLIAVIGYLVVKSLLTGGKIFQGSVLDILTSKTRLSEDENGRTNVLIFGTSGYEMSQDAWDGAFLTDSIMVLSINQDNHDAYMVSLPRDLYVKHSCQTTLGTTAGKLNETYYCAYADNDNNGQIGAKELSSKAGEILGLDVHYYVHADWTALVQAVDAVGGVDITIEASDSRGIYDVSTNIRYADGETAHLDGQAALALARARNSEGGYGLAGGNFDREKNQQKILVALQTKALSVGTLTNPATVNSLLDAMGDNLRTNFKTSEVQTLIDLARNIKSDKITALPLIERPDGKPDLVTTGMINGASVVVPVAGTFDYSAIHNYVTEKLSSNPITRENAQIDVLNGSEIVGLAQRQADKLKAAGFNNIGNVDNAPSIITSTVEIYQLNSDKTATAKALEKQFKVDIKSSALAGYSVSQTTDFIIVFGAE